MKVRVTLKDPDTLFDAVTDAVHRELKTTDASLTKPERDLVAEARIERVYSEICQKWMEYGEYLVVDFDTDAQTATVVPE